MDLKVGGEVRQASLQARHIGSHRPLLALSRSPKAVRTTRPFLALRRFAHHIAPDPVSFKQPFKPGNATAKDDVHWLVC